MNKSPMANLPVINQLYIVNENPFSSSKKSKYHMEYLTAKTNEIF